MYALVDCNNFYASCERVFQPQYAGKPILILSNNDGCVIARSEEAKELGIAMGIPEYKIRDLIISNNVKVFSSNYPLYGDLSNRVMKILEHFTPNLEVYSIDESFMNFDGMNINDYHAYGQKIKIRIHKWVGLPVCIGFAPTKALSKVANKIAKKFQTRTKGVYVIDDDEKRIKALKWTKIEDVWGIGRRLDKKMKSQNINTAFDFIQPQHEAWIKKEMGVIGIRLKYELEGKSVLELEAIPNQKKSIAVTRSFPKQISSFDLLRERITTFASVCAEKLRKQNSCCNTIIVMLVIDKHKYQVPRYYLNMIFTLPFSTNSTLTLCNSALDMLKKLHENNQDIKFKKAGVIVTDLTHENKKQLKLFDEENPKHQNLMKTMDQLNKKNGKKVLRLATQDTRTWNMKQNFLSPRFTTKFNEILEINASK
jgi:DNA polymerase V